MNVPSQVENLIKKDSNLYAVVLHAFAQFEPWLSASGTPFFPEYTDHGTRHIVDVLKTAISLVSDHAFPTVTPADAATLSLACLLHDSAMHLTEDGFKVLVEDPSWPRLLLDNEDPWPLLWTEFLSEASRFDARKLTALFGDQEPAHRPPDSIKDWTTRDRLLIGEFLRRHHTRLAHEIAMFGVPGPTADRLRISNLSDDLLNLTGVVARSHGMPLRACLALLNPDDPRQYKGVHAVFLMALLRVADYLQLQAERAPKELLKVKKLQSPFSEGEWRVHSAVLDIRNTHSDPEAIFVEASPQDVETYLKLKRLLRGLQSEMDRSWAVLGEVYGRYPPLSDLSLNLRRVRSNLDDEKQFASTVKYIPIDAKFDAAGADLLKLLIRPLYGDRPEVGIRELLQNSVDACLELKDTQLLDRQIDNGNLAGDGDPDVLIEIEETKDAKFLRISDRGVGMKPSTVTDYFLRAGASFRNSDVWRNLYESAPAKSRVLRSGRFGVGALAAFLIGDEIEVSTRHVSALPSEGVRFKAKIDTENIQLDYLSREPGTTISIKITDEKVWSKLSTACTSDQYAEQYANYYQESDWDWFCLDEPRVERRITAGGKSRICKQKRSVPSSGTDLQQPWNRIIVDGFQDIHWTHNDKLPGLICNGIKVAQQFSYNRDSYEFGDGIRATRPTVSVFDPDGLLPLNLQRTGLATSKLPFEQELLESQCRDYIAWCIANAPYQILTDNRDVPKTPAAWYEQPASAFAFTKNGSLLSDATFFERYSPKSTFFCPPQVRRELDLTLRDEEVWIPWTIDTYTSETNKAWLRFLLMRHAFRDSLRPLVGIPAGYRQSILRTNLYQQLREPRVLAREYWNHLTERGQDKTWTVFSAGNPPSGRLDFLALLEEFPKVDLNGVAEFSVSELPSNQQSLNPSLLARVWTELTDEMTIPYDANERRELLAPMYAALAPQIAYHAISAVENTKTI